MISTSDPSTMTADQRRREVAAILARGLLRQVTLARATGCGDPQEVSHKPPIRLDLPAKTRLSVAPRPNG